MAKGGPTWPENIPTWEDLSGRLVAADLGRPEMDDDLWFKVHVQEQVEKFDEAEYADNAEALEVLRAVVKDVELIQDFEEYRGRIPLRQADVIEGILDAKEMGTVHDLVVNNTEILEDLVKTLRYAGEVE